MKETLYLSVFGLSLAAINELKSSLSVLLEQQYTLHWTHLADAKLKILLINDDLCEPHLLKQINPNTHILKLKKNAEHASDLLNNTLSLPLKNLDTLHTWLKSTLNNISTPVISQTVSSKTSTTLDWHSIAQLTADIHAQENGKYVIQQDEQILAFIDFDLHRFYQNSNQVIQAHATLERASLSTIVEYRHHANFQDLKHGLWNYFYAFSYHNTPQLTAAYKINCWPQIMQHPERKNIYRATALFSQGSTLTVAQTQLNLSQTFVEHFILCCMLSGYSEEIASNAIQHTVTENAQVSSTTGFRGILNKLRKKLGL